MKKIIQILLALSAILPVLAQECNTATATITFTRSQKVFEFSVSSTKKVMFAPANVYWKDNAYSFFENQYDYKHNSDEYTDLFVFKSNWDSETINREDDKWYNLTKDEWDYLIPTNMDNQSECTRCTRSNWVSPSSHRENGDNLWAGARIYFNNDKTGSFVNGLIILPDNWDCPDGISFTPSACANGDCNAQNNYNLTEWEILEEAGAIFLPAAGNTEGHGNVCMMYMSNTANGDNYYMLCSCQDFAPKWENNGDVPKTRGSAVRLVRNVVVPTP